MRNRTVRWIIGSAVFFGFLLMCSETNPLGGNDNAVALAIQELIGFGIIAGALWAAKVIDKRK